MKLRQITALLVTYYAYITVPAYAGQNCNDFRSDVQSIQEQIRQREVIQATAGIDASIAAANTAKSSCMDQLSSLDMTAFGLSPGAAAIIAKMASSACQQLAQQMTQQVGQITQQVSQGMTGNYSSQIGQITGFGGSFGGTGFGNAGGLANQVINQVASQVGSSSSSGLPGVNTQIGPYTGGGGSGTVASSVGNYVSQAWDSLKQMVMP